ncbi:MAG: hypothetical protein JW719_10560 [Pirellulales bacterium]|nr:hypothetical protein [Pirellulales bacterium]
MTRAIHATSKTAASISLLAAAILFFLTIPARAMTVEAVAGEPFGVGCIRVTPSAEFMPETLGVEGLSVSSPDGRVFYPTIQTPPDTTLVKELVLDAPWIRGGPVRRQAGGIIRGLLDQPAATTVYFLFRGNDPLTVTLQGRTPYEFVLRTRFDPAAHARLMAAWWRQYTAESGGLLRSSGDYPPIVRNYLRAMLARRLQLPLGNPGDDASWQDQLEGQLGFFLGTEKVRLAIARDRMLGQVPSTAGATEPLPDPPDWPPLELPEPPADVKIESIAMRVPVECLYVRFGTFGNFLWLQDTLKTWGGDLSNLVALRGLDRGQARRMEQQLLLKQTALGRLLGPTIISDVAIVGTDMFFREGAAYGILFEARNRFLLENDINRQRTERLAAGGATEKKFKIDGHDVSLIASPDGSVRSYYAADGDYVFITTSETLVRRFLETADGAASLGRSAEFRHARSVMPLSRDDTVFVYLSDAMFRNMAGPQYWIEIYRRLQAAADVELAEMASLVSATEGKPGDTIDELVAGGFLPPEFGPRADGSRTVLVNGEAVDSLRGRRGFFLPVPDASPKAVAPAEASAYRKFVEFYRAKWGRLDPMIVGVKRHALEDHVERVVLDVQANPFARQHFDRLSKWLGPADHDRLAPIPGDLAAFEIQLTNQRLFGGVRDVGLPGAIGEQRVGLLGTLRNLMTGYLGTTGQLGFLSLLDRAVGAPSESFGLAGSPDRLWRHRSEKFTVFSFQPHVLAEVSPQLRFIEAERPAQIRLHVGDVSQAQLTPTLASMSYLRTRGTTQGNLRLLHAMNHQLHVPGPDAKGVAELLLDARLVCPLGGQYVYRDRPDGSGYWTSTALEEESDGPLVGRVPPGYTAPPMSWFRGLEAEMTMTHQDLSAHVEVLMQMPEQPLAAEPETPPATEKVPSPPEPETTPNAPQEGEEAKPAGGVGDWLKRVLPPTRQ